MTDTRATQASVEHWFTTNAPAQVTSVSLEHWATVSSGTVQALATLVAVEHWASVAAAASGTQSRVMVMA